MLITPASPGGRRIGASAPARSIEAGRIGAGQCNVISLRNVIMLHCLACLAALGALAGRAGGGGGQRPRPPLV